MRSTNVPLRIIDDLHNLLSGTRNKQRRLLNLLRWLADELQILSGGGGDHRGNARHSERTINWPAKKYRQTFESP
jgi:hypothetical protein